MHDLPGWYSFIFPMPRGRCRPVRTDPGGETADSKSGFWGIANIPQLVPGVDEQKSCPSKSWVKNKDLGGGSHLKSMFCPFALVSDSRNVQPPWVAVPSPQLIGAGAVVSFILSQPLGFSRAVERTRRAVVANSKCAVCCTVCGGCSGHGQCLHAAWEVHA